MMRAQSADLVLPPDLEETLRSMFEQEKLDEAIDLTLSQVPQVISLTRRIIPAEAERELRFKFGANWPGGSGLYKSNEDMAIKDKRRQRWKDEKELLEARNPRRVAKKWEATRPVIERRYHRQFEDREQLAIMNHLFKGRTELEESVEGLRESMLRLRQLQQHAIDFPNQGWDEAVELWRNHHLAGCTVACASSLVSLAKDTENPRKLLKTSYHRGNESGGWDEIESEGVHLLDSMGGHQVDFPQRFHGHRSEWELNYLLTLPILSKAGTLSFRQAVDLIAPTYAKEAGIGFKRGFGEGSYLPDSIQQICDETVSRNYHNRREGDDCTRFMRHYAQVVLKRWQATAVDHEKLFTFFCPDKRDQELIDLLYHIRDGKRPAHKDDRAIIGRFPAVLELLVQDGILSREEVQPPLKERYLKPNEVLTSGFARSLPDGRSANEAVSLQMTRHTPVIETETRPTSMLPEAEQRNLPALANDLSGLAGVLDPTKTYYVLFKGRHTLFLASEEYFPNGDQRVGEIHRLALLRDGVNPSQGSVVTIRGRRFLIRSEDSHQLRDGLEKEVFNAASNLVPADSYTIITDTSPNEFRQRYFQDFMAHALSHSSIIDTARGLTEAMASIDELDTLGASLWLGQRGKTNLSTFDFGGRFGFKLRYKDAGWDTSEVLSIAHSLTRYLQEVGLSFHTEVELDEHGRARVKSKLEERAFQEEHWKEVTEALGGSGLMNLLCFALSDKRYEKFRFGESREPCEVCKKPYISGNLYRPDLREQWCDGVEGEDLHAIAEHPQTYVNKFGGFKRIQRLVQDCRGANYSPPFLAHPEIMPEFNAFSKAFKEYMHAQGQGYDFWESTEGGIRAEEEELQDDPELARLRAKKIRLNLIEMTAEKRAHDAAIALQRKYDTVSGNKTAETQEGWKITSFWADQLMVFDICRVTAPKLLTQFSGQYVMENPAKLIMG